MTDALLCAITIPIAIALDVMLAWRMVKSKKPSSGYYNNRIKLILF